MPHMKALTAQVFAGTMRVTDDEFDATDGEAKILIALGRAKIIKVETPEQERVTRRAYRRRDMTAQGA